MKDDNVIVLGTLKKEKSSKPFLVLFIFILLIGTCLAFPYIKAYLGDDFNLDDLLNRNNTTTTKPVTTTTSTTTTSEVINNTILTCKYRNYNYEYTFDKDNKLIKIFNSYSFNSEDKTVYEDTLNTYISRSKDINNTILTCKYRNYSYEYTFDKDNKLIKIFNSYSFNSEDKTVYEDTLNTYIIRSKDINNMGGNSKVINDDENNTFVFENIIDKEIDLSSIDVNYFVLSSNYNDVLNQLSGKGFDCK